MTKPEFLWSQADRNLVTPIGLYVVSLSFFFLGLMYINANWFIDYSLCVGFSLQV